MLSPQRVTPEGTIINVRNHPVDELLEGRVCSGCNSGWMSRLEDDMKPLLPLLMSGNRRVDELTSEESFGVARWAAKTAFVLNSSSNYMKNVPLNHFRALNDHPDVLPKGVLVAVHQHKNNGQFSWLQGASWRMRYLDESLAMEASSRSYKIALQFQQLLLLIGYWPRDSWRYVLWKGVHHVLWPRRGPVAWLEKEGFPTAGSSEAMGVFLASLEIMQDQPDNCSGT